MNLQQRLANQLQQARQVTENMLKDFTSPQQWIHQVHPGTNHALWCTGHLATVDNFFVQIVEPSKARHLEGFNERFGMGSEPSSNAAEYPEVDEVLGYFRERRQTLLNTLNELSEEDLLRPLPPGTPEFLSDYASVFAAAVWHEALHTGQISVVRRALGHAPMF